MFFENRHLKKQLELLGVEPMEMPESEMDEMKE